MAIGRVLTRLAATKILAYPTYLHLRAIHVLSSNFTYPCNFSNETEIERYRRTILTNNLSLQLGTLRRHKSAGKKKRKRAQDEESDEDDDDELEELDGVTNSKIITTQLSSLRVDLIVKIGAGIGRNKAEVALYESKIRINGQKVLKKSVQVQVGDMIDVIRGPSPKNPNFLIVSRVTILSAVVHNDGYKVKYTRDKSLLIENYEEEWTPLNS